MKCLSVIACLALLSVIVIAQQRTASAQRANASSYALSISAANGLSGASPLTNDGFIFYRYNYTQGPSLTASLPGQLSDTESDDGGGDSSYSGSIVGDLINNTKGTVTLTNDVTMLLRAYGRALSPIGSQGQSVGSCSAVSSCSIASGGAVGGCANGPYNITNTATYHVKPLDQDKFDTPVGTISGHSVFTLNN